MTAISHALAVLGFFELPDEQQPPERIWLDDKALSEHFKQVRSSQKSGGGNSGMEQVPDLSQNELTKDLSRG